MWAVRCSGAFRLYLQLPFDRFPAWAMYRLDVILGGAGPDTVLGWIKNGTFCICGRSGFISCRYLEDQLPAL